MGTTKTSNGYFTYKTSQIQDVDIYQTRRVYLNNSTELRCWKCEGKLEHLNLYLFFCYVFLTEEMQKRNLEDFLETVLLLTTNSCELCFERK